MTESKDPVTKLGAQLGVDLRAAIRAPGAEEANYVRWRRQVWMTFGLLAAAPITGFALNWWAALPIGGWAIYRFIQHYRLAARVHREIDEAVQLLSGGTDGEARVRAMGFDPEELRQAHSRGEI
jgi:hypothetical protein